ncbi:MAG TPA: hypothetical protein VGL51_13410 [Solirubrobacteraceae bacterium]|jgi:uncharacterized SAM-binding protein YcdF (DUF218 family)
MSWKRAAPLSGIGFVVLFIAGVAVSSVPGNTASDKAWLAAYATHAKQAQHLATGVLLVLAGLSLMSFFVYLWTETNAARPVQHRSPLPIVAAGVSAAAIATGGVAMAASSGSSLLFSQPIPGADVLRLSNDLGFAMVSVAGMLAASLSIVTVSTQARAVGLFGRGLTRLSAVVAVVLLASVVFVPIVALLIWMVIVAVVLMRRQARTEPVAAYHPAVSSHA